MTFEEFRNDIENKLNSITEFELLEFHYEPHSFGNGILAYRIKGRNHKYLFDGRDNELTWLASEPHQEYSKANFKEIIRKEGLLLTIDELKNEITNSTQQKI